MRKLDPPLIVKSFFTDSGLGKAFIDLAKLDQIIGFNLPNNSLPWFALFTAQPEKLCTHISEQVSTGQILKGLDWLKELKEKKFPLKNTSQGEVAEKELILGIDLSIKGIKRALSELEPSAISSSNEMSNSAITQNFSNIWLLRARKGGLHEAVELLEETLGKGNERSGFSSRAGRNLCRDGISTYTSLVS